MSTESVSTCPICQNDSLTPLLSTKDFTITKEVFVIQKCTKCSFAITNPRPNQESIGKYYESNDYISHSNTRQSLFDKLYQAVRLYTLQSKRKLIESYSTRGSLLDYGCGTGNFLAACHDKGWQITGVEPSANARQKAETATGQKINDDIDQLFGNQYDTITLWHVLEHIHDLNEKLRNLKSLLKPAGTLFIAVPNHESWDAKKYKTNWAAYDVPRHLWHFSKQNMTQLLQNHGLRIVDIQPMKFDSYYVSLLSEGYKNPKANAITKMLSAFITGTISNLNARKTTNYSSIIYIAQK